MGNYYLAIDIGASSGRHMLGHLEDGKIILEEVYRFDNGVYKNNGELCWDLNKLFEEIKTGMKKCKEIGKIPRSVGVDTWAVDFVLLDKHNNILGNTVSYRDHRTKGMDERIYKIISEEALYEKTGIQKQSFNTIYQLMAVKERYPQYFEDAENLLMIPDYFHYLLSGIKKTEYTNATTTQLMDPNTKNWDWELIELLGFPQKIFNEIVTPGTVLGNLTDEIHKEIGYNCLVVLPATHDTASAVVAVPSNKEHTLFISSGTWSLMGTERQKADCSGKSMEHNFTNEGGYNYRYRYLKNIMGLWMIQSVLKEFDTPYTYAKICEMASKENIKSIVDCNNPCFLAPESMIEEIRKYCRDTCQQEPVTDGEIAAVIYQSLAKCYGDTVREIEDLTACSYDQIHVVGGGANADYLNQLTASYTGKKVVAGPTEATALGNLVVQMINAMEINDLYEARDTISKSFLMRTY